MWASTTDVGTLLQRPLGWDEEQSATALLSKAEALVAARYATAASSAAVDVDYRTVLRWTVAEAVARVLRNPDGKVSESIDDYTYRRTEASAAGVLMFTGEEWAVMAPPSSSVAGSSGAFTVNTWRPVPRLQRGWPL